MVYRERGLKLLDEIVKQQIKPDQITMVAVLCACSRSGLAAKGNMFATISRLAAVLVYGILFLKWSTLLA